MINYHSIFNQKTLNIFTDASIKNSKDETVGAPGFIAVVDESVVYKDIRILRDSTNNQSEIYAIYMAIQYAIKRKDEFEIINIFSDSQFAVFGLREWIFKWMNNIVDDKIYNSSGKPVANQDIFLNIVYTILQYDLKVNFYHNRGHFTQRQVNKFIHLFTEHNQLGDYIDKETAFKIIEYNNEIDLETRKVLWVNSDYPPKLEIPEYAAQKINLNYYKKLLNL